MDLKMTSRQLEKQSQKLEMGEKAERKKIVDVSYRMALTLPGLEQKLNGKRKSVCWERDQEPERSN